MRKKGGGWLLPGRPIIHEEVLIYRLFLNVLREICVEEFKHQLLDIGRTVAAADAAENQAVGPLVVKFDDGIEAVFGIVDAVIISPELHRHRGVKRADDLIGKGRFALTLTDDESDGLDDRQ